MLIDLSEVKEIQLATGYTDMRKSFNGLIAVIEGEFKKPVEEGTLFLFCGRSAKKLKALYRCREHGSDIKPRERKSCQSQKEAEDRKKKRLSTEKAEGQPDRQSRNILALPVARREVKSLENQTNSSSKLHQSGNWL